MYARSHFSHADLQGKGAVEIHEMLHSIGKNWANLNGRAKSGTFLIKEPGKIADISLAVRPQWKYLEELWQSRLTLDTGCGIVKI
jgi:hypothetical protein